MSIAQLAKASVLEQFHRPLVTREFEVPAHVEPGAAWVRMEMAGICGTDVHLWKGELPIQLPVILGHETVGRIVELGPGLTHDWRGEPLRLGDRVAWNSATSCGLCFHCAEKHQPTRCPDRRAYGIGYRCDEPPHFLGGYAEYHYLNPRATIFKLPDELPTEAVIGAGCALLTAIHGVERLCLENSAAARSSPEAAGSGSLPLLPDLWRGHVVVQGAGPVGIASLVVARMAGAETVTVIGAPRHRLDLARRFGADQVIGVEDVPAAGDRIGAVRELTRGYGADVVLECVGQPAAVAEGFEMCRDGGKYLVLGHYCDAGPFSLNPHVVTRKQLQVIGSWSSEPRHLHAAIELLAAHRDRFPFDAMVTHRFGIEQANEALATTAAWRAAKCVIVPD